MSVPTVELLAPAGSWAALHGAVTAGADAVYLGLDAFNARRNADNFTLETLGEALSYAHSRGVKIYITLNTVILPEEVTEALEYARQAFRQGADGFIVQDLGLADELARTLPEASVHISTQMNIHSEAGLYAAARLGADRVTLARDLSVEEIAHLCARATELGMEVEVFAHGAICVCYSGQCYLSSMIGGRSANRGLCAQACRLPYELHNSAVSKPLKSPGDHLLSPADLCSVSVVPELVKAGVASLKIEGRMKSATYVAEVVAVYREALDRALAEWGQPNSEVDAVTAAQEEERLAAVFSRGLTTAYLEGERGNAMMSYQRPNNRGQAIGRVAEVRGSSVLVKPTKPLVAGDVLEVWTGKGHGTLVVEDATPTKSGCVALDGSKMKYKPKASDRVFRVRSAEAAFEDKDHEPRIPVQGSVRLRLGEPVAFEFWPASEEAVRQAGENQGLRWTNQGVLVEDPAVSQELKEQYQSALAIARRIAAAHPEARGRALGPVVEAARTKAVTAEDIYAHVDRLGATDFSLLDLSIELDEGVGIGFSQLHHGRSDALAALYEQLAPARERSLPRVEVRPWVCETSTPGCRIAAVATNPVCARAAKRAGADIIYVPALNYRRGQATIAGQLTATTEQAGYPKQCVPMLPAVDHDAVGSARETQSSADPWRYVEPGKPVLVESLGSLERALQEEAMVDVGWHLPVTNGLTLDTLASWGAKRVWLSPELTLQQITELAGKRPVEVGVMIMGAQELMITEHCLLMSQGSCNQQCETCARRKSPHFLKDRKGYEFPVVTDCLGRSHLYNSVPLDIAHTMPELLAAGVSAFLVDTTLMNGEEAAQAVGRAVRALAVARSDGNAIAKMPHSTSGHLFRGVS